MLPMLSVAAVPSRRPCRGLVLAVVLVGLVLPVHAEKSDGEQALTFDAGRMVLDGKRKVRTLSGGVEITRGTLVLKAGQIELKETAQGQFATATGADGHPATFRQKREGLDEFVEGQARRIEYDTVSETVRFIDQAQVRVLRGGVPADQVTGQTIVYNHARDVFEVQGGTAAVPGGAGGRVKGVVTPRKSAGGGEATSPETPR